MKNKRVLKFHTGRGGNFYNAGYVTFVGFERIDEGNTFRNVFLNNDETICKDHAGNEVDFEINEDGTGYLEEDTIYDRDDCVLEDDLNDRQIVALERYDGYLEDEVKEILDNTYKNS